MNPLQLFSFPTPILFGVGALEAFAERLAKQAPGRVLLVTDPGITRAGISSRVADVLKNRGILVSVFDGVHPNPVEDDVEAGVRAYRQGACGAIVALGGGSSLDTAKVVQLMISHPPPLSHYVELSGGEERITGDLPSLYAIPTTAGTGSEVGRAGVIILRGSHTKSVFFSPRFMPRMAVLDPTLTTGLPAELTAATGMDALTHCLEAYLAPGFHPICDGIALEGLRLIGANLPRAVENGADIEARGIMQIAASMGAAAFQKGLGMIHSLAHPLSAIYGMHHGLANAILMPPALEYLIEHCPEDSLQGLNGKCQRIRDALSPGSAESLPEVIRRLMGRIGISGGLSAHAAALDPAILPDLSREAFADGCHQGNAWPVSAADLEAVYRKAV